MNPPAQSPPPVGTAPLLWLSRLFLVMLAYYLAGRLGLAVPYLGSHISLIWAPSGIALAALLRWGSPILPGVYIGALLVNLAVGSSLPLALGIAVGNALGPWLAAYCLQRAGFRPELERRRDLLNYLGIGALGGMAISSANGVANLYLAGELPGADLPQAWLFWWLGDAMGVLIAGIPLLTLSRRNLSRLRHGWRGAEALLGLALLLGVSGWLFGPGSWASPVLPLVLVPVLLVGWLAVRSGVWPASVGALLLSALAAWATARGQGPFHHEDIYRGLATLWAYMASLAVINVLITALIAELAAAEERWNFALEGANAGVWDWDVARGRLFLSRRWRDMLGYGDADSEGSMAEWEGRMFPAEAGEQRQQLERHLAGATPYYRSEHRVRCQDGSWKWVLDQGLVVERDAKGRPLRMIGTYTDISDLKVAEQQLSDERSLLGTLVDALPEMVWMKDPQGVFLISNRQHAAMVGLPSERIVGHADNELFAPEVAAFMRQQDGDALARGQPFTREQRLGMPSGAAPLFEITKAPVWRQDGSVQGILGIARDITEKRRAELRDRMRGEALEKLARGESLEAVLGAIVAAVEAEAAGWICSILLLAEDGRHLKVGAAPGLPDFYNRAVEAQEYGEGVGCCGTAIYRGERVVAEDLRTHPDWQPFQDYVREAQLGACWSEPIINAAGQPIGSFAVYHRHPARPSEADIATIQQVAGLASIAIEHVRAEAALRASEERFRSLFSNMGEGVALHELVLDAEGRPADYRLVDCNARYEAILQIPREKVLGRLGSDIYGTAEAPFLQEYAEVALGGQGHSLERYFAPMEKYFQISVVPWEKTGFATIFSDITERKQAEERLERIAHYDALTQLPNRLLFADRLQHALAQTRRQNSLLAVVYLDLDGFKPVNDQFGHEAGDRLLIDVAARLRADLRAGDTVARLGGDEFVLLFGELKDRAECEVALQRILQALAEPYSVADQSVTLSASIGVTLYPLDASTPDTLLRHADQAMYQAKQTGRSRYHFFDPEGDRRVQARHEALTRVEEALENGEMRLHYQPKVNMRHGQVLGAEALIRWQHPERGLLPPGEFLPLVEDTDLAAPLGGWVLQEALRQQAEWQARGLNLAVSVNISGRHLQQPGFVARLQELLARHPEVPPGSLELEILETTALDDMAQVSDVIGACRALGVAVALDDFGTGYSSLTYLKRLPASVLKIDQTFVRDMLEDPEDLAIVEGVIGLAQAFQRDVIAEGVETAEHGVLLLQLGCDLAQGYGIARPMPPEQLPTWIQGFVPHPQWVASGSLLWAREDLPLVGVEVDHRRWIERVVAGLDDNVPSSALKLPGPAECRFGRWYRGPGRQRYGRLPVFQSLDQLHLEVHRLGEELLELKARGQAPAARVRLPELLAMRDHFLGALDKLRFTIRLSQ